MVNIQKKGTTFVTPFKSYEHSYTLATKTSISIGSLPTGWICKLAISAIVPKLGEVSSSANIKFGSITMYYDAARRQVVFTEGSRTGTVDLR